MILLPLTGYLCFLPWSVIEQWPPGCFPWSSSRSLSLTGVPCGPYLRVSPSTWANLIPVALLWVLSALFMRPTCSSGYQLTPLTPPSWVWEAVYSCTGGVVPFQKKQGQSPGDRGDMERGAYQRHWGEHPNLTCTSKAYPAFCSVQVLILCSSLWQFSPCFHCY